MLDGIIVAFDMRVSHVAVSDDRVSGAAASDDPVSDDPVSCSIDCIATQFFARTPERPLSTR